jgi:NAD(P)-dependent dehydrogenase (short-subunit alcohol dehydrogenase family)
VAAPHPAKHGRLAGKVAVVVGAGQTPGDTIGNGFATAVLFAREGARVLAVDRRAEAAEQVVAEIAAEGGEALAATADATDESDCRALILKAVERWGRLDVLHNNVGIGDGDASATRIEAADWDRILAVNLKSAVLPCKYALPVMREQQSGVITNVSSVASVCSTPTVAYKASKAALDAYTRGVAISNARYGIRVNAVLPGLMNTPMAIENLARALGIDKQELIAKRDAQVPLRGGMGSAWDVARAALFLASDEAAFITGVCLPVDGGQSARIG